MVVASISDQHNTNVGCIYFLNPPVIEIIVEVAISDLELEFFKEFFILVNIKCVKHVIALLFGYDKSISHQICNAKHIRHKVVGVGNVEYLVRLMSQYRTR